MIAVARTVALRVYYNPIKLTHIVGIMHYIDQALHSYHTIIDIDEIDADSDTVYVNMYE